MLRALRFIIIAAILLALAWWIGNLPGTVTAHAGAYSVQTSVPAAILILFLLALLFTILLRVAGGLRRAPGGFFSWRGGRRRRLGDIATQRGIAALAAGDAPMAKAEATRARKLLGDTPLALLLTAESARLSGDTAQAAAAFKQLTTHKEMAFLGHRGLLRHSMESGDHETAITHALAAEDAYPGSAWLAGKRLEIAVRRQDWPAALRLARTQKQTAAFAAAAAAASTDKTAAIRLGKQAVKADPTLAAGIVAYANALSAAGKARAARRALLAGWASAPNPLIGAAWAAQSATPIERAQTAAELAAAKPGHPESELLLAQTALAAQLTGEARRHAQAAISAGATDGRAAAILATLDGKPSAAPAPGWICTACHAASPDWSPACQYCHEPASLAWQATAPSQALMIAAQSS
jgi:HemY protein